MLSVDVNGAATAMWGVLNLVFCALCIYSLSTFQGSQSEHQFVPVTITGS